MCSSYNKLIIVVHIINEPNTDIKERTLEQVKIAFNNNADGVFLTIGEACLTVKTIIDCYFYIRNFYPFEFIGINFMCDSITAAKSLPIDANALWIDKGLGQVNYLTDILSAKEILKQRQWKGLYFGGFCLKGNNQLLFESLDNLCNQNWEPEKYFDVCVTSGISTGIPINLDHLKIINTKANQVPIALASGVNETNIESFIPYVKYFIVGTGVEKDSLDLDLIKFYQEAKLPSPVNVGYLDSNKIVTLVKKIRDSA